MTKIVYNPLPEEFNDPTYSHWMHSLLKEYENSFDDQLESIFVNIEVKKGDPEIQYQNVFILNERVGDLTIPFKRYLIGDILSELPNQNDFFSTLRFALDTVVRDYNENK